MQSNLPLDLLGAGSLCSSSLSSSGLSSLSVSSSSHFFVALRPPLSESTELLPAETEPTE